jgi:hypothetical protein
MVPNGAMHTRCPQWITSGGSGRTLRRQVDPRQRTPPAARVASVASSPRLALAQPAPPPDPQQCAYTPGELVNAGHRFFGGVASGLASLIEKAVSQWGYGEGTPYTKNAGDLKVFWQGPTLGWDFGGEGARTMMLIYGLPATQAIHQRLFTPQPTLNPF